MAVRIKLRRGRLSWWTTTNPVLGPSEPGIVRDSTNFKAFIKFGNGTTPWNDLPFFTFETDLTGYVTTAALTTALSNYYTKTEIDAFLDAISDDIDAINTALSNKEDTSNKATNFSTINDTLYPTVEAVEERIQFYVTGLWDDRGNHDASSNLFPSTGGSGTGGAVLKGDIWTVSVAGTLGGTAVNIGDTVRALIDSPGNTASNWAIGENNIGYVPENAANKASNFSTVNDTLYPTVQAVVNYVSSTYLALIGGTLTGALSAPSYTVTGTGGNGFLSLNLQSFNPSAVNNTMRLFMDSSGRFSWVRRNNANSADIKRTLIMPDQNIDYTFPTPVSGTASTLAGLNTAQTFSSQQTFTGGIDCNGTLQVLRIVARSATAGPDIGSASNTNSLIRIGGVISGTTYSNEYSQAGSSTNGLTLETSTQTGATGLVGALIIRTGGVNNASNSNVGANIQMYTREILAGTGASGSILLDVGLTTAGANGTGTKSGIAFFNRMTTPNWQSGQRIIFIGNRDAAPTGNPTGGYFNYAESGNPVFRTSSGATITLTSTTGWGLPSGTLTRTTFDTSTITTSQLAERVGALINDLRQVNGFLSA